MNDPSERIDALRRERSERARHVAVTFARRAMPVAFAVAGVLAVAFVIAHVLLGVFRP